MIGAASPEMTTEEFFLLNELLTTRFGLHFPEHRRELLVNRLRDRVRALGLPRFMDYLHRLQGQHGEMAELARLVTNNETYFFRETAQLESLFSPGGAVAAGAGALRILCAGCSSGEEAYTVNIFARERRWGLDVAIDGIDLDDTRVAVASAAEYGPSSLRVLAEDQRARFFMPLPDQRYRLRSAFRGGVRFAWGNILDVATFPAAGAYDVVLCRNVLIYFSESSLLRALHNFAHALRPGGLLLLGHAETAIGLTPEFRAERLGSCIVYRRLAG